MKTVTSRIPFVYTPIRTRCMIHNIVPRRRSTRVTIPTKLRYTIRNMDDGPPRNIPFCSIVISDDYLDEDQWDEEDKDFFTKLRKFFFWLLIAILVVLFASL